MTVREIYVKIKQLLQANGIEDDAQEARLLVCHFLHFTPADLYLSAEKDIGDIETQILLAAEKRCTHYPLQYIMGEWTFMGMRLFVGEGVLIPRDDTEVLVRAVCQHLPARGPVRGLDLCSGSGAVALGICSLRPEAVIEAIERYPTAYTYLSRNCETHPEYAVTPVKGDITNPDFHMRYQTIRYDFIASNPPYVTQEEMRSLQPEIGHEPPTALLAQENGLFFYRVILDSWALRLIPGGMLAVEIGETQGQAVSSLFHRAGLTDITVHRDLAGHDRCVSGIAV